MAGKGQGKDIRAMVSDTYEKALRKSQEPERCCSSREAGAEPGAMAELSGYGEEMAAFEEAGQSSFGCGNPLAFAGVEEGQVVLDLGSGAGLDLLIAARKVGPTGRVIGVDMTDAMIEAANEHARQAGVENIEVRKGLIEELPVEAASVDWVISNCVINLSPEKERVFAEIHRVLKPGGRFSISDMVAEDLPDFVLGSAAAYGACVAGAIPERHYVQGLEAAGLVDVEVSERLVYSADQLQTLAKCDGGSCDPEKVQDRIAALDGKIASVRFRGRRGE